MKTPLLSFLTFCGVVLLSQGLVGCGSPDLPEPTVAFESLAWGQPVEQFKEPAGVRVSLSTARVDQDWVAIRGVFSPVEEGYHLYSKDMPLTGIDGIGRPTRIEVTVGAIQIGSLSADKKPHDVNQNGDILPVYPEGPVNLYRLVRAKSGASLTVELTYMSCSSDLCNAPVEQAPLTITAP